MTDGIHGEGRRLEAADGPTPRGGHAQATEPGSGSGSDDPDRGWLARVEQEASRHPDTDWLTKLEREALRPPHEPPEELVEIWMREAELFGPEPEDDPRSLEELRRMRRSQWAKRTLEEHRLREQFRAPPCAGTLADELALPDPPVTWTVEGLHPTGANSLLTAGYKSGKTTLLLNLMKSLADGVPFLGGYPVRKLDGRIAVWNYELSREQFRRWLREVGVENEDRVVPLTLRGYRMPVWTDFGEEWTSDWLQKHEVEVWFPDPFARAFTGAGSENSNDDVGMFLEALDVIKARAGVVDLVMSAHTGRADMRAGEERARGATRLDDWADVRWLFTKERDGTRHLWAEGRDVGLDRQRLGYDHATRRMYVVSQEAIEAEHQEEWDERVRHVLKAVRANPGVIKSTLRDELATGAKDDRGRYIDDAVERGYIRIEKEGNAHLHFLTPEGEDFAVRRIRMDLEEHE